MRIMSCMLIMHCGVDLFYLFIYLFILQDKLMTAPATETSGGGSSGGWLFKNKEHGKASAAASLVMI
jgi:hypothetical protein